MSHSHEEERTEQLPFLAEDVQSQQDLDSGRASTAPEETDIKKDENDDPESGRLCPICLQSEEDEYEFELTSCNHNFHANCLEEWLKRNTTCPVCRSKLRDSGREESRSQGTFEFVVIHSIISPGGISSTSRVTSTTDFFFSF